MSWLYFATTSDVVAVVAAVARIATAGTTTGVLGNF
jgi:hypothetical protein